MTSLDQIMAHLRVIAGTQSLAEAQREAREAIELFKQMAAEEQETDRELIRLAAQEPNSILADLPFIPVESS